MIVVKKEKEKKEKEKAKKKKSKEEYEEGREKKEEDKKREEKIVFPPVAISPTWVWCTVGSQILLGGYPGCAPIRKYTRWGCLRWP